MTQPRNMIHERVEAARAGTNPTVVCRVPSGWVVLGDNQLVRGYCILLCDPVVADLNSLKAKARAQYLHDMAVVGDALLEVTDAYRVNYEIECNTVPGLHAHIFPRYMSEPEHWRKVPVWFFEKERMPVPKFDAERDKELMLKIAGAIKSRQ
jgi:diadenosine tetraphosphate (Ap4A) HIT family hydrolase